MNEQVPQSEYLVISRGQWDKDVSREEIQKAIDEFYVWLDRLVDEGKMKQDNDSRALEKRFQEGTW
jgi:hypothetical protein